MKVYRIVELMHRSGENGREFVIERREGFLFKKWKEVFIIEDGRRTRVSHKKYKDAEKHILENYTKEGIGSLVTRVGHIYYVERYNMYTM